MERECEACGEQVDDDDAGGEWDGKPVCTPCYEHFECEEAMRDEELRQMNEDYEAEFGEPEPDVEFGDEP